ncbi:MAG TPA: ribonucleoside-diphosphate reductase subunit alpha [Candidatus Limadaptatus stercorigallinarum]|uniref:Ribonucleoside-diphosphate reductase n=1 Tax=Candidatus Limadaptatus stercorigallinarum TaxID=2840845 RepID=A0A9D1L2E3_9FIRM|nr:ribonucleoside-diphosphate reductase subunit alpha [Candidatus Limadaptatus stercorigallinarum]
MYIVKRDGTEQRFDAVKIKNALAAAFGSVGHDAGEDVLDRLTAVVVSKIPSFPVTVEQVQDLAEKTLMEEGYFDEVKSFILYRDARAKARAHRNEIASRFDDPVLVGVLKGIQYDYPEPEYDLMHLSGKFASFAREGADESAKYASLVRAAVELTTQEAPKWEFIAARLVMFDMYKKLAAELKARDIKGFYAKLAYLTERKLYGAYILEHYTREEVAECVSIIDRRRDNLFTYSSLQLVLKRYVIHDFDGTLLETPQEMFLGIAMHLAMNEKNKMQRVREFYDMLSLLKVTVATPTLSNSRKPYHQLSSCFIDTVPDSLDGIYRSIDNFSKVSKFGGGMGLYFGKVRATGAPIRGFQGAAGGVIRWIRLVNDTAVAVDQLGMRQGAVAVYLDAWHKDLPEFLQLRTNNGDDRMKAHDVFPAVCYPDLFWRMARDNINGMWYMMCPHEIYTVKGYHLEDCYGQEWENKYFDCVSDDRISKRAIPVKEVVRLILKSAVETGTPFCFNRDHVNKFNPNPHKGMIYCSNLCTEIAQNMSPIDLVSREIVKTDDGDEVVVQVTKPGEFVVCNLASLVLGNINVKDKAEIRSIVRTVVRALDNVIDLNFYPVEYAKINNRKYRPIGLGVSGYHHMLAKNGIGWESEKHLAFADEVFEEINYAAIEASCDLAAEKGSYEYFEGSDWQTGAYFEKRGYTSDRWKELAAKVAKYGMRNSYLIAVAPTSSTSIIAGTTAGLDPVMKKFFFEEKKGAMIPRVAPELSPATYWLYKNAHLIDQTWTVRAAGVRQRHIDQAQSLNLYITNEYTMRQVLGLYISAWEEGVKTVYYIRSKSLEVEECESCSS